MSKDALVLVAQNLPTITRARFTDTTTKTGDRALGLQGLALLLFLAETANKDNEFFPTVETMRNESGIATTREVHRLLRGLTELGYITPTGEVMSYKGRGKPTPVYAFTLAQVVNSDLISDQSSDQVDTRKLGKVKQGNTSAKISELEPEPKPEPKPQPEPDLRSGEGRQGKEWGKFHSEVLAECLAWERANFTGIDRGHIAKAWEKDYRPLVALAIETRPQATLADQVSWCIEQRSAKRGRSAPQVVPTQTRHLPDPPTGTPDCEHGCEGKGHHQFIDPTTDLWTSRWCVCNGGTYTATQEPTTERVSPDKGTNTYIPTPGDSADPQSDPVRELTKQFRRVS